MTNTDHPAVHQTSPEDVSEDCIFCTIAATYQPIAVQDLENKEWDPDKLDPPGYVILSTEHLLAFLDIAPLTRGHVLVAPRKHRSKMGDLRAEEMAEIGRLQPLIARAVMSSIMPDIPHDEADYNIVQNNGPGAAQVIPHVHFHIIPRPPLNYQPPAPSNSTHQSSSPQTSKPKSKYPPSRLPTGLKQSYIQFGRGARHELDDDDAVNLVRTMRENILTEWTAEFGNSNSNSNGDVDSNTDTDKRASPAIARFMGGVEDAAWIEGSGGLVRNLQRRGGGKL